jgi:hypothetical protein
MHAVKLSPIFGEGITTDVPRTRQRALLSPSVLSAHQCGELGGVSWRGNYTTDAAIQQVLTDVIAMFFDSGPIGLCRTK